MNPRVAKKKRYVSPQGLEPWSTGSYFVEELHQFWYICAFCVLKAGHDNHLHHSESAWMAVPASFLAYGIIRYVLRLLLSYNDCC